MKKIFVTCLIAVLSVIFMLGCGAKTYDAPPNKSDSALELTLYGFNPESEKVFGLINLGHAFLSVKNVSDSPLTVGGYILAPKAEVSIGTWGQNAHWGIWYNVESTYITLGRYDGRVSLTQGINLNKLEQLNAYLKANDSWTPFKNCSYFSVDLWNTVSEKNDMFDFSGLVTPTRVANRILATTGYATNRNIENFGKTGFSGDGTATAFETFTLKA